MGIRIAINGFGRIGRSVLKALYASNRQEQIQVVAINDIESFSAVAEHVKNDLSGLNIELSTDKNTLLIAGRDVHYSSQANPVKLPWKSLNIDVVLECTGQFTQAESAHMHILAGAKKVLISALSDDKVDATIVYGVNQADLKAEHKVVSNGSCTLNCLAHMVSVLDAAMGVEYGLSTTLHAYDDRHESMVEQIPMIPTKTNSPNSIGLVLPHMKGKIDGLSIRLSTINVAMLDVTFSSKNQTTVAEVNERMRQAASASLQGALGYSEENAVSTDFSAHPASCVFDATQTKVTAGRLVKVVGWFDNEWGFSNRMLDTAQAMMTN